MLEIWSKDPSWKLNFDNGLKWPKEVTEILANNPDMEYTLNKLKENHSEKPQSFFADELYAKGVIDKLLLNNPTTRDLLETLKVNNPVETLRFFSTQLRYQETIDEIKQIPKIKELYDDLKERYWDESLPSFYLAEINAKQQIEGWILNNPKMQDLLNTLEIYYPEKPFTFFYKELYRQGIIDQKLNSNPEKKWMYDALKEQYPDALPSYIEKIFSSQNAQIDKILADNPEKEEVYDTLKEYPDSLSDYILNELLPLAWASITSSD